MNKTYRSIFNTATGTWVAAPETAKGRSKTKSATVASLAAVTLGLSLAMAANAQTQGATCTTTSGQSGTVDASGACTVDSAGNNGSMGLQSIGTMAAIDDTYIKVNGATAAVATGANTIAIGNGAQANVAGTADGNIAIGSNAKNQNTGAGAIVMGRNATIQGTGGNPAATGAGSIAMGDGANVYGNTAVAIGAGAAVTHTGGIAIGSGAKFGAAGNGVIVGTNASVAGNGIAIGGNASITSAGTGIALGGGSTVSAANAVALGNNAVANRANTVSVGSATLQNQIVNVRAGTQDTDAVVVSQLKPAIAALGGDASLDATTGAVTGPTYNVQGGTQTDVGTALDALDTGLTKAQGDITTINKNVTQLGDQINSGQIGLVQQAAAGADLTVGAGKDGTRVNFADNKGNTRTLANVSSGTADTDAVNVKQMRTELANASAADTAYFQADGWSNKADAAKVAAGSYGVAIGSNASATGENSVALGADSVADRDNVVSVGWGMGGNGTRQIINVANGNENTDAVNVQQLKPVIAGLGGGAKIDANTGVVTGPTYNVQGGTQHDVGTALDALDTGLTTAQGDIVNLDGRVTNNETNITKLQQQLGDGSVGLVQQDAATRNITVAAGTDGAVVDFTGTAGARTLTGVADGKVAAGSTEAVNGSQLNATNVQVAKNTTDITTINNQLGSIATNNKYIAIQSGTYAKDVAATAGNGSLAIGASAAAAGISSVAVGGESVASGGTSTAVGLRAKATAQDAVAIGANSTASGTNATALGYMATATGYVGTAIGNRSVASGYATTALGSGATATGDYSLAMGRQATASNTNSVALGQGSVTDRDNSVSVGSAGNERQITNVADGTVDTDAVNLRQLKQAGLVDSNGNTLDAITYDAGSNRTQVTFGNAGAPVLLSNVQAGMADTDAANVGQLRGLASGLGGGAGIGADGAYIAPSYTLNDVTYNNVGDALSGLATQIGQTGDRVTVVEKVISTGESNAHVATSGDQANAASATGADAAAIGAGASASNANSVALGAGSTTNRDNTISVGSAGSERAITNVADAVLDTDAVNKRSMDTAVAGAKSYTDQQIGMVQQALGDVSRKAYSGIAGATALTMIPDVDQGKTIAVGVGVGSYQGYAASAIGVSARLSDRIKVKMGASVSGAGTTYGAGASYQW